MARSEVQHDPSVGCHKGLHVGTWDYASSFGRGVVLEVEVDPRDVVSVPTDCGDAKLRCCRYRVRDEIEAPISSAYRGYEDELLPVQEEFEEWGEDDDEGACDCYECRCDREEAL